jgi:hypothetical protein
MNPKLDIKSTGQHWKKDNDYWCSFDYYGSLYVVKCRWYKGSNKKDILNFESDSEKELTIKNGSSLSESFFYSSLQYYFPLKKCQ